MGERKGRLMNTVVADEIELPRQGQRAYNVIARQILLQ